MRENNGYTMVWAVEIQTVEARDTRVLTFQNRKQTFRFFTELFNFYVSENSNYIKMLFIPNKTSQDRLCSMTGL